jgi:putative transposase
MAVSARQLEMRAIVEAPVRSAKPTWGGRRAGAGRPRKPAEDRTFVEHRARPDHKKRHPTHVTLRARKGLPSFRHALVLRMFRAVLARQSLRRYGGEFQVVHYSIQSNHLHLLIETKDKRRMRSGVSALAIAFAKGLNKLLERATGKVWGDRYHARDLTTPSEVRNALVYVLQNFKKHGASVNGPTVDTFSSAAKFAGWSSAISVAPEALWPPPDARTWLLGAGWTRLGLLSPDERPA